MTRHQLFSRFGDRVGDSGVGKMVECVIQSSVLTTKPRATAMSLDCLSEEFRTRRAKRRSLDLAAITVKRAGPSAGLRRFTGRVIVDGQRLGYLVSGEPRAFEVEPGDHTITVFFGRRPEVFSSRGRASSSARVSLGAGERADFACGIRPEVVALWARARRAGLAHLFVFAFVVGLAQAGVWLLGPYLREAVAMAVIRLPVDGRLIPWFYRLVSPVSVPFWFAALNWWRVRRMTHFPWDVTDKTLLARIGSPYYVERLPIVGLDTK